MYLWVRTRLESLSEPWRGPRGPLGLRWFGNPQSAGTGHARGPAEGQGVGQGWFEVLLSSATSETGLQTMGPTSGFGLAPAGHNCQRAHGRLVPRPPVLSGRGTLDKCCARPISMQPASPASVSQILHSPMDSFIHHPSHPYSPVLTPSETKGHAATAAGTTFD